MQPICTDDELCLHRLRIVEREFNAIVRLPHTDTFAAEVHEIGLFTHQRLRNDAVQVAAMDGDVRKAVACLGLGAEIEQLPGLPGVPKPDRLAGRQHLNLLQRRFQPKRMQNADAVGADLHTGPELAQLRRLFVNFDVDATPEERQRRRKTADAGSDNGDFVRRRASHAGLPAAVRLRSTKTSSPLRTT